MEENSDGLRVCLNRNKLIRTDSKKSSETSESESESQYVDCEDCLDDGSDEDHEDVDGVFDDSNPGLEFEYEPGISLSSLHFYQTCECQNSEAESGERRATCNCFLVRVSITAFNKLEISRDLLSS